MVRVLNEGLIYKVGHIFFPVLELTVIIFYFSVLFLSVNEGNGCI